MEKVVLPFGIRPALYIVTAMARKATMDYSPVSANIVKEFVGSQKADFKEKVDEIRSLNCYLYHFEVNLNSKGKT